MTFESSNYAKFTHFRVTPVTPGVVHVEFNRPKVINSFGPTTWDQYGALFHALDKDDSVRCIVLSGRGPHFCSGLNLKETFPALTGMKDPNNTTFVDKFQEDINAPVIISKPVISVSHGYTIGLGLDIISATTIRLCTKDAKFSIKEIDIGIIADIGSLQRVSVLVGNSSKVNEMALTGDAISGDEAKELGLVSGVYETKNDAIQRAYKLAGKIAVKYVPAVEGTKKHLELMNTNSELVKSGLKFVSIDNTALICDDKYKKFFGGFMKKMKAKL